MSIYTKRGINVPHLTPSSEVIQASLPSSIAISLSSLQPKGFLKCVQEGDSVSIGSPLLRHVFLEGLCLVSPVAGYVHRIVCSQGCRPDLLEIFLDEDQKFLLFEPFLDEKNPSILIQEMGKRGLLTCVRSMPCDVLPDPSKVPRSIFVKVVESAPGRISPLAWLSLYWNDFMLGLHILQRVCPNHLYVISDNSFPLQGQLEGVHYHEARGPHPIGNGAVHLHFLDPITSFEESTWLLSARDVVGIGKHALEGRYWSESFFSIFSPKKSSKIMLVKSLLGAPVQTLLKSIQDRYDLLDDQIISGDVFSGQSVGWEGFMRLQDNCLTLLEKERCLSTLEVASSFFLGKTRFFYCSDDETEGIFPFDHSVYERVCPMNIPLTHLLRACWANDLEEAVRCGLLELSLEEASLFSAVCPARFNFVALIKKALRTCYRNHLLRR